MQQVSPFCDEKVIRGKDLPVLFYNLDFDRSTRLPMLLELSENATNDTDDSAGNGIQFKQLNINNQTWEEMKQGETE